MQQFTVQKADGGVRLDRWFKRHYPDFPTGEVQKACRKGLIRVNELKVKPEERLSAGQNITIKFLELTAYVKPKQQDILSDQHRAETQRWLLFKNEDVICIHKPAGIAVQGGSGVKDHINRRLTALQYDAAEPPRLVHRLDKDTSGVLCLARSANAAAQLAKLFAGKGVEKTYLAMVVGAPMPREGEISSRMEKAGGLGKEKMADSDRGKKAVTAYRVLDFALDRAALVLLQPITGRTHQLRLHMQQIGCPILGDGKYGGSDAFLEGIDLPKQLHLHAQRLQISSMGIDVSAPLPSHLSRSMKALGLHLN